MKNLTFLFLLALLVSCRKQHGCECTTTISYSGGGTSTSTSKPPQRKRTNKQEAQTFCNQQAASIDTENNKYLASFGSGWLAGSGTSSTHCSVD